MAVADDWSDGIATLQQTLMLIPALHNLSTNKLMFALDIQRGTRQSRQSWDHLELFGQLVELLPAEWPTEVCSI